MTTAPLIDPFARADADGPLSPGEPVGIGRLGRLAEGGGSGRHQAEGGTNNDKKPDEH